jgi:dTDP-4-dehydrorhamnose 3,5-epimerase
VGKKIEGVIIKALKTFSDHRGSVMRMMRCDDDIFDSFGEVYFSSVNSGVVKGWKKHLLATQNFAVPSGMLKLVLYDDRKDSATFGQVQEIILGVDDYKLVRIPPAVWYSFGAQGGTALVANCTNLTHDPKESILSSLDKTDIPYQWSKQE